MWRQDRVESGPGHDGRWGAFSLSHYPKKRRDKKTTCSSSFLFPISRLSLAMKWITFSQMRWTSHRDHPCEGQWRRKYRLDPCLHFRWRASCPRAERSKDLRSRIVHQGFHRTKRQHVNFEGLHVNPLLANINIYFLYFPVTRTRRIVLKM